MGNSHRSAADNRRLKWFYQHPLVFIGSLFVISISLIVFNIYSVANAITEKSAEQYAEQYLNALAQARATYSSEVVARVRDHGIGISQEYRTHEGSIPFPATFSIILSNRISEGHLDINTNLYSNYPWPWRVDGGPRDEFEAAALEHLRENPDEQSYVRIATNNGVRLMRYARPVIMQESCVGCHNSMESSPKKDWEVGDVRGVHAVTLTLPVISTVIEERLSGTSLLMLGGTLISLILLAIFIRELRRSLRLVEAYARETEATNLVLTKTNAAFSRFVPHEFLSYLRKEKIIDVSLGDNAQKEMTVLFSDIRNFTTISEKLSPEENFMFINTYLEIMGPIVREHGGFIDKYIGDAIMALFPHADDALNGAVAMLQQIPNCGHGEYLNESALRIGIGLNTGHLMLGTIGETDRMEGTVISDAVNVASRIEGLSKEYGATLLISQATMNRLKHPEQFKYRCIGHIKVKGKTEKVIVYEIFNCDSDELAAAKLETREWFEEAVNCYETGELEKSSALFRRCLEKAPDDSVASSFLLLCNKA
ncbi:MAG: adenylate/guanylate cyclase domain-containing protein [Gammaproteobacteria bacterium]|nr:MAG: adenylate/guanylate cyclase domain-containing protein [Gammaproteobacteria bacterium]